MKCESIEQEGLARLLGARGAARRVEPLHGDGSSRRFFRVHAGGDTFVLLAGPDPEENAAYVRVARHLAARGVRVPEVCAVDEGRGWILLDDLGDRNLWAALQECRSEAEVVALYRPVLELLVRMQILGAEGFDLSVGFASAPYDRETMVEAEGLYFAREFAVGVLGLAVPAGFRGDLERLASEAAVPAAHFLHRDFQSRNIQLANGKPVIIDFQGARPGPLAYDLAALVLDPYAGHAPLLRARLVSEYVRLLGDHPGVDSRQVADGWFPLGAFRLLQALGAYGKLGGRLGKPGFLEHAGTALDALVEHLGERGASGYPSLWALVARARQGWRERTASGPGGRRA